MNSNRQQEFEDSLELLRGRFDELNQDIKRPHSLDADVLRSRLDCTDVLEFAPRPSRQWRAWASLAACFVFVFGAVFLFKDLEKKSAPLEAPAAFSQQALPEMAAAAPEMAAAAAPEAPPPSADGASAPAALAERSVDGEANAASEAAAPKTRQAPLMVEAPNPPTGGESAMDSAAPQSAIAPAAAGAAYAADYTQLRDLVFHANGGYEAGAADAARSVRTNLNTAGSGFSGIDFQEAGMAEGDLAKTDGQYLYSYVDHNTANEMAALYIVDSQKLEVVSKIELTAPMEAFYVNENRLVTLGTNSHAIPSEVLPKQTIAEATDDALVNEQETQTGEKATDVAGSAIATVEATLYDISDRAQPKQIKTFRQDGCYTASRLAKGQLQLVSNYTVRPDLQARNTPMRELVPVVYDSAEASARLLPADRIVIAPDCTTASYAVLSTIDLHSGKSDTQAVLGGGGGVYLSAENLYVYAAADQEQAPAGKSNVTTNLFKFSTKGAKLTLEETGAVDGRVDGQSSFSEYRGNLRVAATAELSGGKTSNNLYVLDSDLKELGALKGLAPGEQIASVCYVGETAYLVTSPQTDPLFAIDLSDPKNPKLAGRLKLPGFSEYLYPLEDGLLLGIGQSADKSGLFDRLSLSLFDVTDPKNPKELHTYNFDGRTDSEALQNPKALLVRPERKLLALPVLTDQGQTYDLFSWDREKGFTLLAELSDQAPNAGTAFSRIARGLSVGDTLYTFSPDRITGYGLENFQRKNALQLA